MSNSDESTDPVWRLVDVIVDRALAYYPNQTYPTRSGVHSNTAFGLAFALDYARAVGHEPLERLLVERSTTYFAADERLPVAWEPGGADFFAVPGLTRARWSGIPRCRDPRFRRPRS